MKEYSYELLVTFLALGFLLILILQYIWLYLISKITENRIHNQRELDEKILRFYNKYFFEEKYKNRSVSNEMQKDLGRKYQERNAAALKLLEIKSKEVDLNELQINRIKEIETIIDPQNLYAKRLNKLNISKKSYACRMLARFGFQEFIPDIREMLQKRSKQLKYSVVMSLSMLGDGQTVRDFILANEEDDENSYRFLLEILQSYTGDKVSLARDIINNNNSSEYIEAIVINSFLYDKFYELKDEYITRTKSQNTNLRTASLKALAQFGEVEFEQIFKIALNDRNWLIRKTAVDGLGILNTRSAINSLANAISDEEWWVRKLAAEAIVLNDTSLLFVEKILKGNDKYAADAIKNALYRKVHINGENIL